jgi:hypothetical protein
MSDNRYYVNSPRGGTLFSACASGIWGKSHAHFGSHVIMLNMSVVEDMRKVLQDFLAPELRSVHARLDAMDEKLAAQAKVTDARFQEVLIRIDATNGRIDNLKSSLENRIDVTNDRIDNLKTSLDLDKRVERLETRQTH